MKFIDGFWCVKEGIRLYYLVYVYDYEVVKDLVIIFVLVYFIINRG